VTTDKTNGSAGSAADFSGILVLDKPLGLTSMTAVAAVRRRAGGVRTGHAGTLDPLATGVLVLALGRATRSIERLMATEKRYRTEIDLTAFTTTDDREGERTEVAVAAPPDEAAVRAALARFTGTIQQRPPAFSAMKVGGRRAYAAARKGTPMELAPRPVRVDAIEPVAYRWPLVTLDIRCGKGFYVRSLARDLGVALGTGGHCASIRRTAVGPFTLDEARPLDALPQRLATGDLLPLEAALARLG
jgi:tRNA pseudouridine55 synthase